MSTREKLTRVFRFLKAFTDLRTPVTRDLGQHDWTYDLSDLPDYPTVRLQLETEESQGVSFLLTVGRPQLDDCPAPPESIRPWLNSEWRNSARDATVESSRITNGVDERFAADPERIKAAEIWMASRTEWAQRDRPARQADQLFQRFFDIRSRFEREGEKIELVVGDGVLNWRHDEGSIHHPILLRRLQLGFDPLKPEFRIESTTAPAELYLSLLRNLSGVGGEVIAKLVADFEKGDVEPLGGQPTETFLRGTATRLAPHGDFVHTPATDEQSYPRIFRSKLLILRRRTGGFQAAIEAILEDLALENPLLPDSLARLVGDAATTPASSDDSTKRDDEVRNAPEILFSKPSNPEQIAIAERLERFGSVLVQGPPGTGKTYTIGNLISHLLAQKKTVLVTSHSTKALRLVRDNVTPQLQPLVVSVLDRDTDAQKQLELSVATISDRLSQTTAETLHDNAEKLLRRRRQLLEEVRHAEERLLHARADEYRDIIIGGHAHSPSDAARLVTEQEGMHGWIPAPVVAGAPCPLGLSDMTELYALTRSISPDADRELALPLPALHVFPDADTFKTLMATAHEASKLDVAYDDERWLESTADADAVALVLAQLRRYCEVLNPDDPLQIELIDAGRRGNEYREAWNDLLSEIAALGTLAAKAAIPVGRFAPSVSGDLSPSDQESVARQLVQHVESNGRVKWWGPMVFPKWRHFLNAATVNARKPNSADEFQAVLIALELRRTRTAAVARWNRTVEGFAGSPIDHSETHPERVLEVMAREASLLLDWHSAVWEQQIVPALRSVGFRVNLVRRGRSATNPSYTDTLSLLLSLIEDFPAEIEKRLNYLRLRETDAALASILQTIHASGCADQSVLLSELRSAVTARDVGRYGTALAELRGTLLLRGQRDKRTELLEILKTAALTWATAIGSHIAPHNSGTVPSDPDLAWRWRQLTDELERRSAVSLDQLSVTLSNLHAETRAATTEAVEASAWLGLFERTDHTAQQALHGWTQVIRKIGAGTGKRVDVLRREAQRLMTACQRAIPVWVMPLSRVVESFDPRTTKFDVVIVDESSQLDVVGMIALYMGTQAVVVGDNEQVSPDAVGLRLDDVQKLIDTMLQVVPNSVLYDGQTSIYDLAESSFGGAISLKEHFRCVPDIIGFSNRLAYGGSIRPLRSASSARVLPSTFAYRVENRYSDQPKTNSEEVEAIASLIVAATRMREYDGLTFGVLSLVGEEQASLVERRLRQMLRPDEIERRRLLCGNAAQFQGDERDVMFLSAVDKPQDGPLALRQEKRFRQRFNVAASRARDQMWVVHSLRPELDLKPGDLRRLLIEHATDPRAIQSEVAAVIAGTESVFEARMAKALVNRGYEVKPQVEVGYYRIDMVVACEGRLVAIECDGDRFHSGEQLRADMARQAVLERLGWRFIRVRGSEFFRNEAAAIHRVVSELTRMRIYPSSRTQYASPDNSGEVLRALLSAAEGLRQDWRAERAMSTFTDEAPHPAPLYRSSSDELPV